MAPAVGAKLFAQDGDVSIRIDEVSVGLARQAAVGRPAEVELRLLLVHDAVRKDVCDAAVPKNMGMRRFVNRSSAKRCLAHACSAVRDHSGPLASKQNL